MTRSDNSEISMETLFVFFLKYSYQTLVATQGEKAF